ncbi:hypothetical protein BAUCODRAFT_154495 [Baudoinia panamericana UAMH 10762]|uniref:Extradiol ring-cleavage dioxygenase class III enzyme subunit B domain-containing protein n=1 Tax=Baudoinia panamericana (strain UAMH 10762) TaxID=717646 RepID=M2NHD8_BAUPA|nr:uncharacterized protein BAUCODRAFT_154495 [Baudoinia panamericana UAMH 10762]EMC98759.1 hypothetical protein BAUCODRAFT_154495 [Baudoinia panamericana UAMH 10762]
MAKDLLAPVHFISHGTASLIHEPSRVKDYWKKLGQDALDHGVKGVIIMGAHWNVTEPNRVRVGTNPNPNFMPLVAADSALWKDLKTNTDIETSRRVIRLLQDANIDAVEDPKFDWMIDTEIPLVGMFGTRPPPVVIISQNSYWDPWFHIDVGAAVRPLRKEGYLLIGSGGGTHNLYRTEWKYTIGWKDPFAMEQPPRQGALEFRQALEDGFCKNKGGPPLRRAMSRLMKHPYFREAHGTDEHYVSACFVAGACGEKEDEDEPCILGAEVWELRSQSESQYTLGRWPTEWRKR